MSNLWGKNIQEIHQILGGLSVRDHQENELEHDQAFSQWKEMTLQVGKMGGTIYFIGNGASASMASHFAADIVKSCRIRTNVFTDLSLLTALANDISYEDVFAEPLRWYMKKEDMLVAISSSGNSPNIVRGVKIASSLRANVITLSAMNTDNRIRQLGDLNFYVLAKTYGLAETAHAAILHYWIDLMDAQGNPL